MLSPLLRRLEAEAIEILRETASAFERPVMLYSVGKDSGVMLHLAHLAFAGALPFPLLHIDTGWKFRDMIVHRDAMARRYGARLIVHTNREAAERGISPVASGAAVHTHHMKTLALKQALAEHGFDAALAAARRDEERSRAKERIFSVRNAAHAWDPRSQRPELWRLWNTRLAPGQTMRVFPLSNWTERDVWAYTHARDIPIVPLYLAAPRPVVRREGALIMLDDDRLPLEPGEEPELLHVRFRSLGCYPLTAATPSTAATLDAVVAELALTRTTERAGRLIDTDSPASMERKKREGYF